ncbi:MAG: carboxypeptidase regulatory-like domain-containing protein [Bryobacteraceae bacterium]
MSRKLIGLALSAFAAALAQFESATVLGTLTDPSGAVVAGGKVALENVKTGVTINGVTNASGNFDFINVPIGSYRIRAEAAGFRAAVTDPFTVTVNARQRVDLSLTVGEVSQTVSISGAATALETDSSDRGQLINSVNVVNLPLNGRSYADLALLAPGVRKSVLGMDPNNSNYREASFNVNGLRSAFNNFQVDGVDNNTYATSNQGYSNQAIQLSPDAVSEFKVQTNNYSAEYGRAGGAIVNVSVKSGTNAFHGAAWNYLRNTSLNAVGYFKPALGKPVFQQNQFGGAVGGPIRKNKTFFFADYEGLRRATKTLSFLTLPNTDQRNGIFKTASGAPLPVRNPFTGQIFSDGIVPKAQITPFAQKVFSQLPTPNNETFLNNYQALPRVPSVDNKGDVRVDHYFSSKLTGFIRYSHREFTQTDSPTIPLPLGETSSNGYVNIISKQGAGGVTYTLSPTSLIEVRLGITRSIGGKWPIQIGLPGMLDAYGIPGAPNTPDISGGLNTQSISGFNGMGRRSSTPQFQNPLVINPKINYSKIFAKHSVKVGWEMQTINTDVLDFSPQYGQDNYGGQYSAATAGAASNNAYNVADFLFGARSSYSLTNVFTAKYRQRMNFFYVQDDWKVNNRLTLNLGTRYEYATPQWEDGLHLANYDLAAQKPIYASSGSIYNRALVHPDRNNFGPRVGFALRATPGLVIRGGYGASYIHFNRLGGENLLAYNPPSVISTSINNPDPTTSRTCAADVALTNCFRPTALGYTSSMIDVNRIVLQNISLRYTPADTRTGYVQSWHVSIQKEIAKNWVFDIAYVGNHSLKLITLADVNQARPQAPNENSSLNSRRPMQAFGEMEISWNGGWANYHGLQTKVERKFSTGFYFLNSFTWSKAMDNAAGHLEVFNGDNSRMNYLNQAAEKGLGSYNQPFNDTATLVYDLPYGKGRKFAGSNPILQAILGGWRSTLINTMGSGLPVSINYSPATRYTVSGYPTYRPNLLADPLAPKAQRNIDNYFNKANVVIPVDPLNPNPFGNGGRNTVRSYALYQTDLGLHKEFPLFSESRKLEFRSEFFNLFNKTNFQGPNSTASSSAFGTIRSTFPARVIQFALRLSF